LPSDCTCLGPPPLIAGEDAAGYDELLARIAGTLQPADMLEQIWVRDVVDLVWEIFRLRRLKSALLSEAAYEGLKRVLGDRLDGYYELSKRWVRRDPAAIKAVDQALAAAGLTMEAVRARTLALRIDEVERIDRMTMVAEGRRDSILRELERHRASFAQRLRRVVHEAEDAEFKVVAPEPGDEGNP
jgi:hypothetical protein